MSGGDADSESNARVGILKVKAHAMMGILTAKVMRVGIPTVKVMQWWGF